MSDAVITTFGLDFHWPTLDPFLFCAHHHDRFPAGNAQAGPAVSLTDRNIGQDFGYIDGWNMYHGDRVPGFPAHPHRGFETITIVREGLVDHADSMGAAGRYGHGDVQWLTTGKGVQHSEMFPLLASDTSNPLLLFQVWLNLPARAKMAEPYFAMFWQQDIPVLREQGVAVEIVAGSLGALKAPAPPPDSWASDASSELAIWHLSLDAGASWTMPAGPAGTGRVLYIYEGEGLGIDGSCQPAATGVQLRPEQSVLLTAGATTCRCLLLQGRPIGEPVERYGPFVMNTRQELQQAFDDYRATQFGGWPWQASDPVHGQSSRFARHADGREEYPDKD